MKDVKWSVAVATPIHVGRNLESFGATHYAFSQDLIRINVLVECI